MSKNLILLNAFLLVILSACQPASRNGEVRDLNKPTEPPASTDDKSNPQNDAGKDDTTQVGQSTDADTSKSQDDFKDDVSFTATKELKSPLKRFQIRRMPDTTKNLTFSVDPKEANGVKSFAIHASLEDTIAKKTTDSELELTAHDANLNDAISTLFAGTSGLKSVPPASDRLMGAGNLSGEFITTDGKKLSIDWPALDGANQDQVMLDLADFVLKGAQAAVDSSGTDASTGASSDLSRDMSKPDACVGASLAGVWKLSRSDKSEVSLNLTAKDADEKSGVASYDVNQDVTSVDQTGKSSTVNDTGTLKFDQKNCLLVEELKAGGHSVYQVLGIRDDQTQKISSQLNLYQCKDDACKESSNQPVLELNRAVKESTPVMISSELSCEGLKFEGNWKYKINQSGIILNVIEGKLAVTQISKGDGFIQYSSDEETQITNRPNMPVQKSKVTYQLSDACVLKSKNDKDFEISYKIVAINLNATDTTLIDSLKLNTCRDVECKALLPDNSGRVEGGADSIFDLISVK